MDFDVDVDVGSQRMERERERSVIWGIDQWCHMIKGLSDLHFVQYLNLLNVVNHNCDVHWHSSDLENINEKQCQSYFYICIIICLWSKIQN